mmetsp:Transcript_31222/g.73257  ORF Transcript_31222/g.73257 Transcript_31222/m.73257 type:complete len:88 (-) Transcript_31222:46-309(-)
MVLCFSGCSVMSRAEMERTVRRCGGHTVPTVNRSCTHLVSDYPSGTKAQAAQKKGIPIISNADFLKLIEQPVASVATPDLSLTKPAR